MRGIIKKPVYFEAVELKDLMNEGIKVNSLRSSNKAYGANVLRYRKDNLASSSKTHMTYRWEYKKNSLALSSVT